MDSSFASSRPTPPHEFVPIKQEPQRYAGPPWSKVSETDTDSMTASPVSDTDKLSFPAAAAMLMTPQVVEDDEDLLMSLAFDDDDSSDSYDPIKPEAVEHGDAASMPARSASGRRAMTPEERRQRRNLKERLRVQNVKDRIEKLRNDMEVLQRRHDEMQTELQQRMIVRATSDDDIQSLVTTYLSKPGNTLNERDAQLLRQYLLLLKETEQLQFLKRSLEDQLRPRATATGAVRAVLTEANARALEIIDESTMGVNALAIVPASDPLDVVPPIRSDAVSLLEDMLADDPLSPVEARGFVEETCREMMEGLTRRDWIEGFEGFGWRGSRRLKEDNTELDFRLSQVFKSVSATTLVQKTWHMLTNLDEYRRIQPQTQQLRVIQRVNDECWVIGIAVGKERPRLAHVLVARAIIHGGFLITFRTLPLLRKGRVGCEAARRKFVEKETGGMIVNMHSWYNFQERPNASGGVDCEVIFGGSGRYGEPHYLKQLQTEVVAGITRWQSAVGFSTFVLSSTLVGDTTNEDQNEPAHATSSKG